VFYTETTEDGRNTIMEVVSDGVIEVLPSPHSTQSSTYEYGGAPFNAIGHGQLIFSDKDKVVKIFTPGASDPDVQQVTGEAHLRYSDFSAHPKAQWVIAIEEDHEHDEPSKVKDYIVAINYERKTVKRIVAGADFYYIPQFSPDGTRLCWLQWDNPRLPFGDAILFVADCDVTADDVTLCEPTKVTGGVKQGVAEPRWGPDGALYFAKEVGGYRRPFRIAPGEISGQEIILKEEALRTSEFGEISLYPSR
jgi:hypothetical protein